MHTMHCARNITLCKQCNEPIPKLLFGDHEQKCRPPKPKIPPTPPSLLEQSSYFQSRKAVEDRKAEARKERYLQKMEKLADTGYSLSQPRLPTSRDYSRHPSYGSSYNFSSEPNSNSRSRENGFNFPAPSPSRFGQQQQQPAEPIPRQETQGAYSRPKSDTPSSGMLACKYCDLELPKLDLDDHENYCGSRTDKCMECGELVMFKDKQAHMSSNHGSTARRNNAGEF